MMRPRSWFYRQLQAQQEFSDYLNLTYPRVDWWHMQDQPPSTVLAHVGPVLALGRNVASQVYVDYAGANWSNPSGQIARHTPGVITALLDIDNGVTFTAKSWETTFTVSNRTAGSVRIFLGSAVGGTARSTNDTFVQTLVGISGVNNTAIQFAPTTDFDGDIDLATVSVKQTGILASSAYTLGNDPMNGANTGITMGQVADGNLGYAGLFDAVNDYGNISSAEINSKFNPAALTLIAFGTSNTYAAGVDYLVNLKVDANNSVSLSRSATNFIASYKAGGTDESITIASGSPSGFFMLAITVNVAGDAVIAYYNGYKSGTTQTIAGTWVGNLAATTTLIGALITTPTNSWSGNICRFGLAPYTMTALEIADIWQNSGLA